MSETLFPYYERELLFIRQFAQEFARQYPAAAGRLLLEPNRSTDPHIERLIESFALLSGRIHHKLDDEFPELTEGLLGVLYPHYLAPIPSLSIVQFELDAARAGLPDGFLIDKHSRLTTRPIHGLPCRFRTGYPVTLWPVHLVQARLQPPPFPAGLTVPPRAVAALRLQFECLGGLKFSELSLQKLRFYLAGDAQLMPALYELLFNHAVQVVFRPGEPAQHPAPLVLAPEQCLTQVGFNADESLLVYPARSYVGYRLLTEFFAFPYKFMFLDLGGWQQVARAGFEDRLEVVVFLNRAVKGLEQGVDANTFRVGCTPIVNLFEQIAEPIALTQAKHEYRIVPDVAYPLGMEAYSVEAVSATDPLTNTTSEFEPFYSFRHGRSPDQQQTFWYASRRKPLDSNDKGTDVYLTLVDLGFNPRLPAEATLVVRTMCTNRELPAKLQHSGEQVAFELEAVAPLARIQCLRTPTAPLRAPLRRGSHWRLVSHLCLNHLSLSDPLEGLEALQEILRLYDFSDPDLGQQMSAVTRQLIEGITAMSTRRVIGRTGGGPASGFCRGMEVTLEFDEQKYVGTGVFLFASMLERFLGLYAGLNSFSQLVAKTKQGEGYFKKWPPRAGELPLV